VTFANAEATSIDSALQVETFAGPDTADRPTAFQGLNAQERFVQALYLDELGRAGSQAELDSWGGVSAATAASAIAHSFEARQHLVDAWYVTYLGRAAAGHEDLTWVNKLLNGETEEKVISEILGDAGHEFYNRAQTLVASGTANERYVQALYLVLLHRTAGAGEVAGWVNALQAPHPLGLQDVASAFMTGASGSEFRHDLFEGYYNALLHRPSDGNNLDAFAASAGDACSIRIGFESSPEFFTNG
jgi:hypothetical protein